MNTVVFAQRVWLWGKNSWESALFFLLTAGLTHQSIPIQSFSEEVVQPF